MSILKSATRESVLDSVIFVISAVKDLGRKFGMARTPSPGRRGDRSLEITTFLCDGNDPPPLRYGATSSRRFDERRLRLVDDQFAQERNETEASET